MLGTRELYSSPHSWPLFVSALTHAHDVLRPRGGYYLRPIWWYIEGMDGGEPPRYVVGRCGARIEVGASYPHPYSITNNEFVWSFVLIGGCHLFCRGKPPRICFFFSVCLSVCLSLFCWKVVVIVKRSLLLLNRHCYCFERGINCVSWVVRNGAGIFIAQQRHVNMLWDGKK